MSISKIFAVFVLVLIQFNCAFTLASAESKHFRWVGSEDKSAEFDHVIEVLNLKSGLSLSSSDFLLVEDRNLANNHFGMYVQVVSGVPVSGTSIRLWTDLKTKELIQAEAAVEDQSSTEALGSILQTFATSNALKSSRVQAQISAMVKALVKKHNDDPNIRDIKSRDVFENGKLIRVFSVKAKHGTHIIKVSILSRKVISNEYREFPNADTDDTADEFSIPALVFPVYEEDDSHIQQRVVTQLKHLKRKTVQSDADIYASLKTRRYLESSFDPILGLTPNGQAQGFWSMADIKQKAAVIRESSAGLANNFANGVVLEGRYATININPDALTAYAGINFTPKKSTIFLPAWRQSTVDGEETWEMIPSTGFLGRPLTSFEEAYQRPARRLPDHNPTEYINDGFDEIQVYYAINTLFDSLHLMGFLNPELSTQPFHAFLYDPDISNRDNAYYTDDTINFTNYSPMAQNYARDNSTIWHELGHGIMDRLMGDYLHLADTGGLSEGMADFVAALVIEKSTGGKPFDGSDKFRIINNMGFHLTNEVHDDGEAYGGAMRDLMVAAKEKFGPAEECFDHMVFADQLGHEPIRKSGELKELILSSLGSRNFVFGEQKPAQFTISYAGKSVEAGTDGSRQKPIPVTLAETETATYPIQIAVQDGDIYKYQFPLTIRVSFEGGPLQGAIHWENQENNHVDYVLNSAADVINVDLKISGVCDEINRPDGSCSDFTYVQVLQKGLSKPIAKKRFYLRMTPKTSK
jgi:hypothetical protein